MGRRANVVVIVSDTFRRDHLGAYGNRWIHTPHLDEFARSGVVFEQHFISSFPTMPARADILCGTHSFTHMGWEPLPSCLPTLPQLLSEAGYTTMGIVDTPFFVRNGYGYDRGFDDFIWVRGQGDDTRPHERSDYRSTWKQESDRCVARTISEAESWLERHYKEEFFLYVDTWDPHEPWDAPSYYTSIYKDDYAGEQVYPSYGKWQDAALSREDLQLAHATYCGEVSMVDFWVGRLVGKLDALGLRENTYVFFTSDHGFYFGEHGYFGKAEWINSKGVVVQGAKLPRWLCESWLLTVGWSPLYGQITRIPLLVRGPGLASGRRCALSSAPDIAPTIADLVGVGSSPLMQGQSLLEVLEGSPDEQHRPFVISSWPLYFAEGEFTSAVDSRPRRIASYMPLTISTRNRSLILGGPEDEPELYDLGRDPQEQQNIWHSCMEEGVHLVRRALTFLQGLGTPHEHLAPRWQALDRISRRAVS